MDCPRDWTAATEATCPTAFAWVETLQSVATILGTHNCPFGSASAAAVTHRPAAGTTSRRAVIKETFAMSAAQVTRGRLNVQQHELEYLCVACLPGDCPHMPRTGSSWIAVVRWRPRPSCLPHGDRPLAVELIEGHGAGGVNGSPAGTPGCRRARGPGSGMAGRPAGCLRTPGDPGPGGGRQPGIIEQAGVPAGGRTPVNVAVEPAGAVPGRRGPGGCGCPVRRARSCHHAE